MSLSASTIHSWRAAGNMFSRLATLRLLPLTRGLTTSAMSHSDRSRIRARATGRALSPGSRSPRTSWRRGMVLIGERAQIVGQAGIGAMQRLQHRDGRAVGGRGGRHAQRSSRKAPYRKGGRGEVAPRQHQNRRETESAHRQSSPMCVLRTRRGVTDTLPTRPRPSRRSKKPPARDLIIVPFQSAAAACVAGELIDVKNIKTLSTSGRSEAGIAFFDYNLVIPSASPAPVRR